MLKVWTFYILLSLKISKMSPTNGSQIEIKRFRKQKWTMEKWLYTVQNFEQVPNFEQRKSIQDFEVDNLNCGVIVNPPTLRGWVVDPSATVKPISLVCGISVSPLHSTVAMMKMPQVKWVGWCLALRHHSAEETLIQSSCYSCCHCYCL